METETPTATTPLHVDASRRERRAPELLIESLLIVLSVALGFAVTQWQDRRRDAALAAEALTNFRREIGANLKTLERVQPKHAALVERLRSEAAAR